MQKVLIIQTASIGDVILATAVAEQLHDIDPEQQIDFLVKKGNEQIFDNHLFIKHVFIWDKSIKLKSWKQLLKIIRSNRYDLVIDIQRFFLTGLWTILSKAKQTRGFSKNPLSLFFSKRYPHIIKKGVHEVQRNFSLIEDLTKLPIQRPKLYPKSFPEITKSGEKYFTISPASLWFTKQYPSEKWIELIDKIPDVYKIFLLGGKNDIKLCQKIKEESENINIEIKAGELSLIESAALMSGAAMNFVNDSSPMHLASSMNAPVTAVYCSTTPDYGFGPLSDQSFIVQNENCSCRPCGLHGRNECPNYHFDCAYKINTNQLYSKTF